ncbi:hypothetical protein PGT21_005116 [Puccinia graminis f. sp. tritici]|uniref:Uncharacterized protein n=1 Tax=Puccinia graminis f. sp. tritici TaxID=56615 RepID=A0A5B0PG54_PUCGR|nr:hypothetical protein PGTUg99_013578 [Puccinia graminis f. sp. tritici]KAA1099368.1 hypothetical protein PGT21_005116 [Puccinia graminis f. sp. tritici]
MRYRYRVIYRIVSHRFIVATSAAEAQLKLADKKLGAAQDLLKEGHSSAEVEALLKIIYG